MIRCPEIRFAFRSASAKVDIQYVANWVDKVLEGETEPEPTTQWYLFEEHHSGSRQHTLRVVLVEARSLDEANLRAPTTGIVYFDGVDKGRDCACCGDRWYRLHPAGIEEGLWAPLATKADAIQEALDGHPGTAILVFPLPSDDNDDRRSPC